MLKKLFDWFVWSSANPEKVSATLKGLAGAAASFGVLFGLDLSSILGEGIDIFVHALAAGGVFVGSMGALWGFARKVKNTFVKPK